MNRLGLSAPECVDALRRWRERLEALRLLLASDVATSPSPSIGIFLYDLLFELQVDLESRATTEGRSAMTAVESAVFEPTLQDVRALLDVGGASEAAGAARAAVDACVELLRSAEDAAAHWRPGVPHFEAPIPNGLP